MLPIWKFLHENSFSAARLSRERLRTVRNGPLQIGHLSRVILQVQQRLCPLLHSMMGGAMYSVQTGHSSSCRSRRWRSSVMLFISACELAYTQVWNLLTNVSQFVMSFIFLHGETADKYKVVQLSLFGTHIRHCLRITDGNPPLPMICRTIFAFLVL